VLHLHFTECCKGCNYRSYFVVLQMNNYMRRFPNWNESNLLPPGITLSPFSLINEVDPVPHGVCNLGVLLFDSSSLDAFMSQLTDHEAMRALQPHCKDRFLDSLCFVSAVHRGGIEVIPLPIDLNYFVLLEDEVAEAVERGQIPPPVPRLAHFMADASLELILRPRQQQDMELGAIDHTSESSVDSCICLIHRDHPFPLSSLITELVEERCAPLCTAYGSYPSTSSPIPMTETVPLVNAESLHMNDEHSGGSFVRVVWPVQEVTLFSQLNKVVMEVVVHHWSVSGDEASSLSLTFDIFDTYILQSHHSQCSDNFCESYLYIEGFIPTSRRKSLQLKLEMTVSLQAGEGSLLLQQVVTLRIVCPHLLSTSHVGFNNLHQRNTYPYSLSSQTELAHFLNLRNLHTMGLVLCCDTDIGLQTSVNLIQQWGHRIQVDPRLHIGGLGDDRLLVIAVQGSHPSGVAALAAKLAQYCDSRLVDRQRDGLGKEHQLGCVILQDPAVIRTVSQSIIDNRERSLSFVYTDVFTSYTEYADTLHKWFPSLVSGGILAGSQYHVPGPTAMGRAPSYVPWREGGTAVQVKSAVDACAYRWAVPVFATHFENPLLQENIWRNLFHDDRADGQHEAVFEARNQYPAWYIFNNARSVL
jgi:hypothetical protein